MVVVRPPKPYPDFPLYAHSSGQWAKKIGGKLKYFGLWDDPDEALRRYEESLKLSIEVKPGMSIELAGNTYLTAQKRRIAEGTLSQRSFLDLRRTVVRFAKCMGQNRLIESLQPTDFLKYKNHFARTNNLVSVGNEITRVKTMLNWLVKSKLIQQIDTGPDFRKPPAKAARKHKRERGLKLFTPDEIQRILNESGIRMRAMILLGINCGYHNNDIETLPLVAAEAAIESRLIEHARQKTEIERVCPLWPETIDALKAWLFIRPRTESRLAFVLHDGRPMSTVNADVGKRFRSVRDLAGVRDGGFSWLRKTFATYASEAADQVAVDFIMGHVDSNISGIYRQMVRSKRLQKPVNVVREWLLFSEIPSE
ncbi:tyrosine-type recombinase/integrase [Pirellulaceae bacterium SH449]